MTVDAVSVLPGQIWRDDCYYLNRQTGACERKYLAVLAADPKHEDIVTAVFTSKSHGLTESPACSLGPPPRAGYFVGVPGGVLPLPSWLDFNSAQDVDEQDFRRMLRSGRLSRMAQTVAAPVFCGALRCLLGFDDLTGRQARLMGDVIATLRIG